jgi:hypothetical protein
MESFSFLSSFLKSGLVFVVDSSSQVLTVTVTSRELARFTTFILSCDLLRLSSASDAFVAGYSY